jgi:hypothetical protein
MKAGIVAHQISTGLTITPVLYGSLQIRVRTRIILEVTLQVEVAHKEGLNLLQDIQLREFRTGRIHTGAQKAILCLREAAWKEVPAIHPVPLILPQAADLRPHMANPEVHTHPDLHPDLLQVLHQALLLAILQVVLRVGAPLPEEDRSKQ